MSAVSNGQLENFYEAAFVGLKALDARADVARRFGPNADARWALFKGEMKEWERLELLMPELDLADQVLLVTDSPAERQLFGIAVMLLGSSRPVRQLLPSASAEQARAEQFPRAGRMLVSDDVPWPGATQSSSSPEAATA
ncbi:hypothetical protein ACN28S_41205 [Cystobacter fuscus]